MNTLLNLPKDVLPIILSNCSVKDCLNIEIVCKGLNRPFNETWEIFVKTAFQEDITLTPEISWKDVFRSKFVRVLDRIARAFITEDSDLGSETKINLTFDELINPNKMDDKQIVKYVKG